MNAFAAEDDVLDVLVDHDDDLNVLIDLEDDLVVLVNVGCDLVFALDLVFNLNHWKNYIYIFKSRGEKHPIFFDEIFYYYIKNLY